MITPSEIRKRLKVIRECAFKGMTKFDDENAHFLEDRLYADVLAAIAADPSDARQLARLALNTRRYKFSRWAA